MKIDISRISANRKGHDREGVLQDKEDDGDELFRVYTNYSEFNTIGNMEKKVVKIFAQCERCGYEFEEFGERKRKGVFFFGCDVEVQTAWIEFV